MSAEDDELNELLGALDRPRRPEFDVAQRIEARMLAALAAGMTPAEDSEVLGLDQGRSSPRGPSPWWRLAGVAMLVVAVGVAWRVVGVVEGYRVDTGVSTDTAGQLDSSSDSQVDEVSNPAVRWCAGPYVELARISDQYRRRDPFDSVSVSDPDLLEAWRVALDRLDATGAVDGAVMSALREKLPSEAAVQSPNDQDNEFVAAISHTQDLLLDLIATAAPPDGLSTCDPRLLDPESD